MNLLSFFRSLLASNSTRSSLRNKPGGMAWIRGIEELNGRIVATVAVDSHSFWVIDPPLTLTLTRPKLSIRGVLGFPGDVVTAISVHDDCLEPIPDTGVTTEEVTALYASKAPERSTA